MPKLWNLASWKNDLASNIWLYSIGSLFWFGFQVSIFLICATSRFWKSGLQWIEMAGLFSSFYLSFHLLQMASYIGFYFGLISKFAFFSCLSLQDFENLPPVNWIGVNPVRDCFLHSLLSFHLLQTTQHIISPLKYEASNC